MKRLSWSGALRMLHSAAVLGALAVTVSCIPPYFVDLDAAARLIRHMTPAGTIGPYSPQYGVQGGVETLRFLPSKPTAASIDKVSITSGFNISSSSTEDYVTFVYAASGGGTNIAALPAGASSLPVAGADPNYPLYEYDVVTSPATQPEMFAFRYDPAALTSSLYFGFQGDTTTGQMNQLTGSGGQLTNNVILANTPIGGSIDPVKPVSADTFSFVVSDGLAILSSASAPAAAPPSIFPAPVVQGPVISTPLVPFKGRMLFFNNVKAGAYVAEYWNGAAWVCVQLGATPTAMTGVTRRLDAVLSDGDFLSTEGGNLTLYDSTGTGIQLYSTPLNGLQFCYEAFVGSTPYVFFSLLVADRHGNEIANIFAIPTSQMRNLGQ